MYKSFCKVFLLEEKIQNPLADLLLIIVGKNLISNSIIMIICNDFLVALPKQKPFFYSLEYCTKPFAEFKVCMNLASFTTLFAPTKPIMLGDAVPLSQNIHNLLCVAFA